MKAPKLRIPERLRFIRPQSTAPLPGSASAGRGIALPAGKGLRTLPSPADPILRKTPPSAFFTMQAMHRAWRAVRAAGGGAGVDGVTLQTFSAHLDEELSALRQSLIDGSYRPRQVRQIYIPKNSGGLRPLIIWALRDRIAQRVVYDLIAPAFDAVFLPVSFGFRTGMGVQDAAARIVEHRDAGLKWVVDADIKSCFEEINIKTLRPLIRKRVYHPVLLRLIDSWLRAGIMEAGAKKGSGLSQGGVLSPLMANIYLHEFDKKLVKKNLALVRYADDFIICTRRKSQAQLALADASRALHNLGLTINPHKTRIIHFDQGFKFIGYFFVRNQLYRL